MAVNPMLTSGVNGMHAGIRGLRDAAQDIAEMNVRDNPGDADGVPAETARAHGHLGEMASAIVDLTIYQRQVQASAEVVRTADEVLGFLIDVHA